MQTTLLQGTRLFIRSFPCATQFGHIFQKFTTGVGGERYLKYENVAGACNSHGKHETFIHYFSVKLEGKRQFGRSWSQWERNITMEAEWQVMTANEQELL
jgi:hypothetical protein